MYYLIPTKSGTVIEETTIQHVTRDDMIDAQTVAHVENINTDINERLDGNYFFIELGEGGSNLEDEVDLQQYDQEYRNKYLT